MKNIFSLKHFILIGLPVLFLSTWACQKEDEGNELPVPVELLTPAKDSVVALDPETDPVLSFEWSELPGTDRDITYRVLFDRDSTLFEVPVYTILSGENGTATSLSLHHSSLDSIAALAGIAPKRSGIVKWAVDATNGDKIITSIAGSIVLNRPTSLGTVPDALYIYGTATTAGNNPENALKMHKNSNGVFEIFTSLKSGSYFLTNNPSAEAVFYYIKDGELYRGESAMEYSSDEKTNLVRVNFNNAIGDVVQILAIELIIPANGDVVAELDDLGSNLFGADNAVFSFLQPGGPGSPDWLSWVEERYRFRMRSTGGDIFYGSYHDASMYGVFIPGMTIFPFRPDGEQPEAYYNVYAIPPTIDNYEVWAGCYKFPTAADGVAVNIRLNLDPAQTVYVHSLELAK